MATRDASGTWASPEFDANTATTPAERGLCLLAMFGAVAGAFAGSALAAGTAGVLPAVFGMVGAVSGSGVAAAVWSALVGSSDRHS